MKTVRPGTDVSAWRQQRRLVEGKKHHSASNRILWQVSKALMRFLPGLLRLFGLYQRGVRNAQTLRYKHYEVASAKVPKAFDGYRVLFLSDFHFGMFPEEAYDFRLFDDQVFDLVLLGGDFKESYVEPAAVARPGLEKLMKHLRARDGVAAVLGNHDESGFLEIFRELGIKLLINETVAIDRRGEQIYLTGLDDCSYFYSTDATAALDNDLEGFRMALVHSPDMAIKASGYGYDFYVCGHTHGGQIALPGGVPIITLSSTPRNLSRGRWQVGDLQGVTSCGVGVTRLPLRYHTLGEATLITLQPKS